MDPVSMQQRGVVSSESVAGEIQDHKLHFFSKLGFAEALSVPGETFHGVLHCVEEAIMKQLDKSEVGYTRSPAKARRYDTNEIIDCYVYTRDPKQERGPHVDSPPMQRYIEILISGAEHFGLDPNYIGFLKNHPRQPRTPPNEFKSVGAIPEGAPTITLDHFHEMNAAATAGRNNLPPLYFTVNDKVLKCLGDREADDFSKRIILPAGGPVWDITLAKICFDMKYGAPDRLEDFTREHSAYVENLVAAAIPRETPFLGCKDDWQIYGRLARAWKD